MRLPRLSGGLALLPVLLLPPSGRGDEGALPADARASSVRHLDLAYEFGAPATLDEWKARAAFLREHLRASTGLLPEPPRGELKAQVFGRVDRGDHTVEKVFFESLPGVYVTGNLYRPQGASGRRPAILNPHGHWSWGRLENIPLGSGPLRALSLARQGYVAFAWDMVGFGDSTAIGHGFGGAREALWGLSLMGLQTWNSIRALDFVASLPDVDPARIGCTGESGGGTQTFMLSALDERVRAAAPVNMVSAHMQGGCLCENAPNLRVPTDNVEIAALTAPRPLFLVAATGDWTKNTPRVEYPAIRGVYGLFGVPDQVRMAQFDAPHNYDRRSREAVYGFLAHVFLGRASVDPLPEAEASVPPLSDLVVFYGRARPADEASPAQLAAWWTRMARSQIEEALPREPRGLEAYRGSFGVALRHALMASLPASGGVRAEPGPARRGGGADTGRGATALLMRPGHEGRVPIVAWRPSGAADPRSWVIVASMADKGEPAWPTKTGLVEALLEAGHGVLGASLFPGRAAPPPEVKYFATYNRADAAHRVQDVLTAVAHARAIPGLSSLSVIGTGRGGLPVLLARAFAPAVDRYAVDVEGFASDDDEAFLRELPVPGIRRAGDFLTAGLLDLDSDLLVHDTRGRFRTERLAEAWRNLGRDARLETLAAEATEARLVEWLARAR